MIEIRSAIIDLNRNVVAVNDKWGHQYTWDMYTEVLPKYVNDFMNTHKVTSSINNVIVIQ